MSDFSSIIREGILFDILNGEIINGKPLQVKWNSCYGDLKAIAEEVTSFEFGVYYNLGVRTILESITELWMVRGSLNENDKIDNITATIGWNEQGHDKLLKYRSILINKLGRPAEEQDNFVNFQEAANSYGPFNKWSFGSVDILLWGSDFRGSMWYKIDIKNNIQHTLKSSCTTF
jgi:hypothetical protein